MDSKRSLLKQPSVWIPIVISFTALTMTVVYLLIFGIPEVRAEDEGVPAHIFQLLMAGQLPIIAFYAIKYLPLKPKQTFQILAI